MFKERYRTVRIGLFCFIEKTLFGFWLKADKNLRVLSLRPAKRYINPKVARAAYEQQVKKPKEVVEYLD
jgi:hypothetical protein